MRARVILLGCVAAASPPAGPGDAVVATVGGRPVWASCVAAQAARGTRTRRAALGECVDFELLAQAAEARGVNELAGSLGVRVEIDPRRIAQLLEEPR